MCSINNVNTVCVTTIVKMLWYTVSPSQADVQILHIYKDQFFSKLLLIINMRV